MVSSLVLAGLVALLIAGAAALAVHRLEGDEQAQRRILVERVNSMLPQTQCGQCDFAGCRPYAEAMVDGRADINQCPPGGQDTIDALAGWFGVASRPLNPAHGVEAPAAVALIREDLCIGCKLCIKACPVDAIVGAPKQMHTVIASECTGCELCIAPCPVDCIDLVAIGDTRPQVTARCA